MDKKDEKILKELMINARIPINRLAKKILISREVTAYRIKRLVEEGIIKGFNTYVDIQSLNFSRYVFFLQLKRISPEKENIFFDFLRKQEYVIYVGSIVGKWNVVFDILARDKEDLKTKTRAIINEIEEYLENYVVSQSLEMESFPAKIFGSNYNISENENGIDKKIDEIDKKILSLLTENARADYKELSNKINLTANAIKYRIKNLEKNKVIIQYSCSINYEKIGFQFYNMQIKLLSLNKEKEIKSFFSTFPQVVYFYKYIGNENWDTDIGLLVKDQVDLRNFLNKLRRQVGDIIKIHDIYSISEEIKPNIVPKEIFY